jgi:hypothetical protein
MFPETIATRLCAEIAAIGVQRSSSQPKPLRHRDLVAFAVGQGKNFSVYFQGVSALFRGKRQVVGV